jgi:hypothetical protein
MVFATSLVTVTLVNVSSASTDGNKILALALKNAAKYSSVKFGGSITSSNIVAQVTAALSKNGLETTFNFASVGAESEIETIPGHDVYVKSSTINGLGAFYSIKAPTSSEVNRWYKVPTSDKRYATFNNVSGPTTTNQLWSFNSEGWGRDATYEGTAVLRGVHVIKLAAKSAAFSAAPSGLAPGTLYVTQGSTSLPFAMSFQSAGEGLVYFSDWGKVKVVAPSTSGNLPS